MCDNDEKKNLKDNELWDKAGSGQQITRDNMGVNQCNRENGLQSLNEGFDFNGTVRSNTDSNKDN